jgi:hypothetical protein
VCAEVLHLTPELLGLQACAGQGTGFSQHQQQQQPGRLALMPLLGQMQELRSKVVAAAADLASLAIQVGSDATGCTGLLLSHIAAHMVYPRSGAASVWSGSNAWHACCHFKSSPTVTSDHML